MIRALSFKLIALSVFLTSCGQDSAILPKPRMYPKIEFPERAIKTNLSLSECPFEMEYWNYYRAQQQEKLIQESAPHPCWFDIRMEPWDCSVHLSYYPITETSQLQKLVDDAFKLAGKHHSRASFINELKIDQEEKKGFIFEIEGPVASPLQFYLTDEKEHFLRGALYFDAKINRDSIAPMYQWVRQDVIEILETVNWKS